MGFAQYFEPAPFPSETNSYVRSMFYDDSTETLYVGGSFLWEIDGQMYSRILKIENGTMYPMGCGFNSTCDTYEEVSNCRVTSIVKFQDTIYVSGKIDYSGNNPLQGIAKWDGIQWQQAGNLYTGGQLKVIRDTLFVLGSFEQDGMNSLAFFNTNTQEWNAYHEFPNWIPNQAYYNSITDMIEFQNEIYVSGNFNNSELGVTDLVKWTGNQWLPVEGICGGISGITEMEVFDDKLVICGLFDAIYCSNNPGNGIASFDGQTWDNMQGGMNSQVNHIALLQDQLFFTPPLLHTKQTNSLIKN
jgi:hypothetical protein